MAEACAAENDKLINLCAPSVATVLRAFGIKDVVLMRGLAFTCRSLDISSPAYLLIGLPMMRWAPGAEGLMRRIKPPNCSIAEFLRTKDERNAKILRSTKASSDPKLDEEAYKKTMAEVDRGVLQGPFESMEAVPLQNIALVPRHGIWEQHGGATEQSCRNIDDMLVGENNDTIGTVSAHRPTDPYGLVAQVRAVRIQHFLPALLGWPCDLEKAYKQVPQDPTQIAWTVIVTWSPSAMKPAFFIACCQLFGEKAPHSILQDIRHGYARWPLRFPHYLSPTASTT